jgi:class 3 adenylate cyclase/predicted ATPase
LFCDLVGSTELSARLDPEELRDAVRAYQVASGDAVRRYDGYVAQYLGDGVLVYFGYPAAHEDDAERAVRAALGIVEAIRELTETCSVGLAVRVGIHTGLVVVGEMGGRERHEQLALGETPNVAARLQGLAEPGSVVISGASYKLVQRTFACQDLGLQAIKGIAAPVPVYRVLGEHGTAQHASAPPTPLGPLVGREPQTALLLERWESAAQGFGQVVLITGEPGIGKSRLIETVRERSSEIPHTRLEASCSPYHQASPMYAVIRLLSDAAAFRPDDSADTRLRRLEEWAAALALPVAETLPLLVSLLGLPAHRYPLPASTPQRIKERTIASVLLTIRAMAARHPVLLIIEDLHWVDASTLELLTLLVEQVATAAVCTLVTARPEFSPSWTARSHASRLMLDRLPLHYTESIVLGVTGGKALPAEVLRQIVARTDGVPLFVEELTKMVLESQLLRMHEDRYELTGPLPPLAIPMTLKDSLMSRLDRLATVKVVAQLGAVLGREFSYPLLEAVASMEPAALERKLARLVDAEIVYQRGIPPDATYVFKHALIQETAYQSLLKSARQDYHRRVAQVLEERFDEIATSQPETVARHYTEAGRVEQAVPYWRRAGENAARRSANTEAITHFTRGLELVRTLPVTRERARQEFEFLIALGPVLQSMHGWAAPETAAAYVRARALGEELGDTAGTFRALFGQWLGLWGSGELGGAQQMGEELLRLARAAGAPTLLLQAHHALWPTRYLLGDFTRTQSHVEEGLALCDPDSQGSLEFPYGGHDAGVCGCSFGAYTLWALGYPEQAQAKMAQGLELAERLAHPFTTTMVMGCAANLHMFRREEARVRHFTNSAIALSTEHGFPQWRASARVWRGWSLAVGEERDEGIREMRQGIADWKATQAKFFVPMYWALIAEACLRAGRFEEGEAALAEATNAIADTGERFYEAEVSRLIGELALARSPADWVAAEAAFLGAIEVARRQEARSWELRATTSLARLWQGQGKREQARQLLGEAYGWFTEGFDTLDLRDARALLSELDGAATAR